MCRVSIRLLQVAVDASLDGDTIIIETGTYYENVTVDMSISLGGFNSQVWQMSENEWWAGIMHRDENNEFFVMAFW